jgi:hypothetical protein
MSIRRKAVARNGVRRRAPFAGSDKSLLTKNLQMMTQLISNQSGSSPLTPAAELAEEEEIMLTDAPLPSDKAKQAASKAQAGVVIPPPQPGTTPIEAGRTVAAVAPVSPLTAAREQLSKSVQQARKQFYLEVQALRQRSAEARQEQGAVLATQIAEQLHAEVNGSEEAVADVVMELTERTDEFAAKVGAANTEANAMPFVAQGAPEERAPGISIFTGLPQASEDPEDGR